MLSFWEWLLWVLAWLSSDPRAVDLEQPKAAAAVAAARASMVVDAPPSPAPSPQDCDCGKTCVRGVWKPDGRVEQQCRCQCDRCKAERAKKQAASCPTGTCPQSR